MLLHAGIHINVVTVRVFFILRVNNYIYIFIIIYVI